MSDEHTPSGPCSKLIDNDTNDAHLRVMSKRAPSAHLAVAYVRVSTDDQALGPEAQRASIEAWAAREGVQIASWHVDAGVSGASPIEERPALCGALAALREHGAGLLVVAKRDRIARDVVVAALVERAAGAARARVVSVDGVGNGDSPADAFMRTVIDGAAAYERALIRARTKAALGVKRARGERAGEVPYGYRLAADGVRLGLLGGGGDHAQRIRRRRFVTASSMHQGPPSERWRRPARRSPARRAAAPVAASSSPSRRRKRGRSPFSSKS